MTLSRGDRIGRGRYELVRFLHAGGAGVVWSALDLRSGEAPAKCAVKVLDAANGGRDTAAVESEVAVRVRHPSVVPVRDSFEEDGRSHIVMDLARGSLADLVERTGRLRASEAVACGLAIAEGLGAAHRAGVVHRDVKPQNVLVWSDGRVALSDFGASRSYLEGGGNTRTGVGVGTVPFLAPEQRRDPRAVRPATDVYALAITVAWLLLGVVPDDLWSEEAADHLRSASVPEGLIAVLAECGARKPEDRPSQGDDAAALLRACGVVPAPLSGRMQAWGESEGGDPPSVSEERRRPRTRWSWVGWLGGLGAAFGVGAALSLVRQPETAPPHALESLPPCTADHAGWEGDRYPRSDTDSPGLREAGPPAIADLDGDGWMDVAFPHQIDAAVRVFWGEGRRQLGSEWLDIPFVRLSLTAAPAFGDVDEDGDVDLVGFNTESASLHVLANLGERRFVVGTRISQPSSVARVQLADWDRDGHLDLLVNASWDDPKIAFGWRKGDGRGSFAPLTAVRMGQAVILNPDRAIVWSLSSDEALFMPLRHGRAVVEQITRVPLPGPLGGLSGNGWPVVGWHHSGDGLVPLWIRETDGPCRFPPVGPIGVPSFGDIDGDGRLDAAWAGTCPYCTSAYYAVFG